MLSAARAALVATLLLAGATPAYAATPPSTPNHTVGFDGNVWATVYVGSTVYVGGEFRNAVVAGKLVPRMRLAAIDARTGALLPWAPGANNIVRAMTAAGSSLYIAGAFTTVGGQPRAGLAGVDLRTGAVGTFRHSLTGAGYALAATATGLYLGGQFNRVDGRTAVNLAAFRLPTGALDTGFGGSADDRVYALAIAGSRLYVGGRFRKLSGASALRIGAVGLTDGRLDTGFHGYAPYWTLGLAAGPGGVFAGLAGVGGRVIRYRSDGVALWTTVTDGDIQALAYLGGTVYAGGHFTMACPKPSRTPISWCPATLQHRSKLEALDAATGALTSWNPNANSLHGVTTISAGPAVDRVAIGGIFTRVGGVNQPHFAQFGPV